MIYTRAQLVDALLKFPATLEVGTDEGFVVGVEQSTYDDEDRANVPYINLEIEP